MNNRLEILAKIDKLHDSNCVGCVKYDGSVTNTYCTKKCVVGKKLQELGNQLLKQREDEINKILAKGRDITLSDVEQLLLREVHRSRIAKALGMSLTTFNRIMRIYQKDKEEAENLEEAKAI